MGSVVSLNAFKKDIYFLPLLGIETQFLRHKTNSLPITLTMQKYMQALNVIHTSNFRFPSSGESTVEPNFQPSCLQGWNQT